MFDEEFHKRLESVPDRVESVQELFIAARSVSEARFFLAILDFETMMHKERNYLTFLGTRHWVIQQFADYLNSVIQSVNQESGLSSTDLGRRLRLLAYSQFWECLGVQRMLMQLVRVASGDAYSPRLLLDRPIPNTYETYKKIRAKARMKKLKVYDLLTKIYSNQIRNAFVHSDFWMQAGFISFENHDRTKVYSIPGIRYETWERLFALSLEFIDALFTKRREVEREVISLSPYRVELPEFNGPFSVQRDDRKYWTPIPMSHAK